MSDIGPVERLCGAARAAAQYLSRAEGPALRAAAEAVAPHAREIDHAIAEIARLRALIERLPHETWCAATVEHMDHPGQPGPCHCAKQEGA